MTVFEKKIDAGAAAIREAMTHSVDGRSAARNRAFRIESATERTNIHTTTIYPAAINTELLEASSEEGTAKTMQKLYDQYRISPDCIANVVALAIDQPDDTINEFTVGPANQLW